MISKSPQSRREGGDVARVGIVGVGQDHGADAAPGGGVADPVREALPVVEGAGVHEDRPLRRFDEVDGDVDVAVRLREGLVDPGDPAAQIDDAHGAPPLTGRPRAPPAATRRTTSFMRS